MDDPKLPEPEQDAPVQKAPQWLHNALDDAIADAAAGHSSPWPEAWARLEALNKELDAELSQPKP